MKLPIYIVSDNHFLMKDNQNESNRRKKLFNLFNKIKQSGGSLIIGGDFFDFWFEFKNNIPSGYNNILNQLESLNKHNIDIHYVLGNHDYWDFGFFKQKFGAYTYKDDFKFTINGKQIIVSHGDGLLKHDYLYRFMKKIIRNKFFIFLFKMLNKNIACRLAENISKNSRGFHKDNNLREKEKNELKTYAEHLFNNNIDTVLLVHYHETGINKINNNTLIYLGDWIHKFTVTKYSTDKGWQQIRWS